MRRYTITVGQTAYVIDVAELSATDFRIELEGRRIDVRVADHHDLGGGVVTPGVQVRAGEPAAGAGASAAAPAAPAAAAPRLPQAAHPAPVATPPATAAPAVAAPAHGGVATLTAPMPGVILAVETTPGAAVARGDTVLILEAMKMKNALKAPRDATIADILVQAGQSVKYGDALVRFAEE